ncbi:hypothetical protein [Lentisalinibacter orientalis]|uniref:hypothetical protein n=1 Tax=Lentisalinibacter orientalis TaxID=2992241 RepID=UPI00386A4D18
MADPGQGRVDYGRSGGDAATVGDETVSRAYRELARERPPAALDKRIRAQARRAPPARPWQRPLAIAATLALAVALVLQVATPPDGGQPVPSRHSEPGSPVGDTALDEAAPATPPASAPVPLPAAPSATERLQDEAALPAHALQPDRADAGQAVSELGRASRKAAQSLAGNGAATASTHCTDHVADADAWLDCIAELEAAGEQAAAERERRAWAARHGPEDDPAD